MNVHEEISRYVDGEMNAEEQKAFEEQLNTDAALREEVALYKEVYRTLQYKLQPDKEEQALLHTLHQMRQRYFAPQAKVIPIWKRQGWMLAAAAAVFIVVLIWSPWKQNLYEQYAAIKMTSIAERGSVTDSLRKEATEKFNNGKYAASLSDFEKLLQANPGNAYFRFYYSIALMEEDQLNKSRTELKSLWEGSSFFRYYAAYYMALTYLKEKNRDACKEWLQKIPPDAGIYPKAQELLKKL